MNLNAKQVIAIVMVVLGVIVAGSAQLTDLFGKQIATTIISVASLANSALGGVLAVITSQTGLLKDVQAMDGVQSIKVNANANTTLASMAVDNSNPKIEAAPGAEAAVRDIATRG